MLVKRTVHWVDYRVRCDRCKKRSVRVTERDQARAVARRAGWVQVRTLEGELDLCPACKRARSRRAFDALEEELCYGGG